MRLWKQLFLSAAVGLALPALALVLSMGKPGATAQETTLPEESGGDAAMLLRVLDEDGKTVAMDMQSYLTGVVLAEMPTDFEAEALKAQAVVARTYALKRLETGDKHPGSVCTRPGCCQGYRDPEEFPEKAAEKAANAVEETDGQVLRYGGELIDATYFSCSGGSTEDAAAVWGADVPYLQAVDSPGENAAYDTDTVRFSAEEFAGMLEQNLPGEPEAWFGPVTYTRGGGVDTMEIGGRTYRGTELRSIFGLRSTDFTVSVAGDTIEIETHGFGHRVGMSQYGADAMAASGSSFDEILAHYYVGTSLEKQMG